MRRLLQILGGAAALLLLAEFALRVCLGLGYPLLIQPNPLYGYLPAPNQDLHRFFSHIHINAYGMRSEDIDANKRPGEMRILLVGDSVLFGTTYVSQAKIFSSLLQRDLGPRTEVMNASAGGWAPANELGLLKAKGVFGADLVVFVLNTEDLTQPYAPYVESPAYPLRDPSTAIGEAWQRYIKPRFFGGAIFSDPGSTAQGSPLIDSETPKILATLSEAHRLCEAHRARFVLIYSPAVLANNMQYKSQWDAGVAMLLAWAHAEQVPVVDLRPAYATHPAKDVYLDGIHLKPLGQQLMETTFLREYTAHRL